MGGEKNKLAKKLLIMLKRLIKLLGFEIRTDFNSSFEANTKGNLIISDKIIELGNAIDELDNRMLL